MRSRSATAGALAAAALGAVTIAACGSDGGTDGRPQAGDRRGATAVSPRAGAASATNCPVTTNNTRVFPPGERRRPQRAVGNVYFRDDGLWTVLWPNGVTHATLSGNGSLEMKFPWWREHPGRLRIAGRRLDAAAPRLRARIPRGYGPVGFQSSSVIFSTAGCWTVTATAGRAKLTFVTLVVKPKAS
jgi:hypothetical protein